MRRYIIPILFFVSLTASIAQAADAIGFREITLPDPGGTRPLHAVIWYPAADDSPQTIVGDNPAITGLSVIKDARTLPGPHPLVVMSHGYGGTWRNLNWLAGNSCVGVMSWLHRIIREPPLSTGVPPKRRGCGSVRMI